MCSPSSSSSPSFVEIVAALHAAMSSFEPSALSGQDAAALVEVFSEGERLCQAGRTLTTSRVVETAAWVGGSHPSAAAWLASKTRGTLWSAISTVGTAARLRGAPATRSALVQGTISEVQAARISKAVEVDPSAEDSLLAFASAASVEELRSRCAETIAAALSDEERDERIRRGRYVRKRTDEDGAFRLDVRTTQVDGAALWSVITAGADDLQTTARRSGWREPTEAFRADALLALALGKGNLRPKVTILIDETALSRGHTVPGETSKVAGAGPITVTTARQMLATAAVTALATDGADVTRVVGVDKMIPPRVQRALEARDQTCVVPGCGVIEHLEIDHIWPSEDGGPSVLWNLARLCRWHHGQKTFFGWVLSGPPGAWRWDRSERSARMAQGP